MSKPLISVIVPIYNVEKYLKECLESIKNQTYQHLEIILVDDGSPDKCGEICDEYALNDRRIKVIHKQNGGAGMARNAGLDIASGEYCIFPDPDDVMYLDQIEYLYSLIEKYNVDMPICSMEHVAFKLMDFPTVKVLEGADLFEYLLKSGNFSVWNKLFPMRLIKNLRFESFFRGQDAVFTTAVMAKINSIAVSPEVKYFYRLSDNSVTFAKFKEREVELLDSHQKIIEITKDAIPNHLSIAYILYQKIHCDLILKIVSSPDFLKDIQIRKSALKKLLAEPIKAPFIAKVYALKYYAAKHLNIYLLPLAFKLADFISGSYQFLKNLKK